jgi:hypothetical protein
MDSGSAGRGAMRYMLLIALTAVVAVSACRGYPTRSVYHRPTISSVTVFPNVIGQGDSAIVTVFASDPDGDTLVYDWFTDARLIIKDGRLGDSFLYNTASNSRVFYRSTLPPFNGRVQVSCSVRDVRGGSDSRAVLILLRD